MARNVPDNTHQAAIARTGASPTSYNRPNVDAFTEWTNQAAGGANPGLTDYSGGPIVMSYIGGASVNHRSLVFKAAPASTPWSIDALITGSRAEDPTLGTTIIALMDASGKQIIFSIDIANTFVVQTLANGNGGTAPGALGSVNRQKAVGSEPWQRIVHTGAGLEFYYSYNRFYWYRLTNVVAATALAHFSGPITKVGWGTDRSQPNASEPAEVALWSWVEY